MKPEMEARNKFQILALLAHHAGIDAWNFVWAARTSRLSYITETMIAEACGSPDWIGFIYDSPTFDWAELKDVSLDELKRKDYMQVCPKLAGMIFDRPDIAKYKRQGELK